MSFLGSPGRSTTAPSKRKWSAGHRSRRGGSGDPAWAHRRLLLAARDRLSRRGLARLTHVLATSDPTNEIGAAWGIKELLRQLLATPPAPGPVAARRFYDAVLAADLPEATRLAETVQTLVGRR